VAVRDATPLGIVCEQVGKRVRITLVQRLSRCTQLIDHTAWKYGSPAIRETVSRLVFAMTTSGEDDLLLRPTLLYSGT
jgi:hypothetical protein